MYYNINCSYGEVGSKVRPFSIPNSHPGINPPPPSSTQQPQKEWQGGGVAGMKLRDNLEGGSRTTTATSPGLNQPRRGLLDLSTQHDQKVGDTSLDASHSTITPTALSSSDTLRVAEDDLCTVSLTELSPNSTLLQAQDISNSSSEVEKSHGGRAGTEVGNEDKCCLEREP